jgi:hypothetical protein
VSDRDIELGPFFAAGVVLVIYGLRRRRPLPVALGIASIVFEQGTEPGRALRRRIRQAVERTTPPE